MNILKQSTGLDVRLGPFVDASDGVTPETGITLAAADQAEGLKADGAATVDISGRTWAAVTGCDGWYDLTLTTADTDTIGELVIVIQDSSVCLPVFARFQVVEEAIYDALFASAADGFDATGQVTVGSMAAGTVTAAAIATGAIDADAIAADAITNAKIAADAIGASELATDCIASDQLAATAVTDIWAKVCESQGSYTAQQIMSIMLSALAGVTSSGGAVLETPDGVANRISATVNASNERTAMTLTPSS